MYDKYDNPHGEEDAGIYERSPLEQAGEMGGSVVEKVRPHLKKIIAAVVILAVLFFAYDFFIGSVKTVSFKVTDTEGNQIEAGIKVMSSNGQEIKRLKSGEALGLKSGDYRIDVQASGYKTLRGKTITVSDSAEISEELESDRELELAGQFPSSFATGDKKEFRVTVTSNEKEPLEAVLLLEGDAKNAMEIGYDKPLTILPGSNDIDVTLTTKKDAADKYIGQGKTGIIRIEGLDNKKAKIEGKYSLTRFQEGKFRVTVNSSDRINYGKIRAGETVEKTLKVENDNKFDISDIKAGVKISSTEFSKPEEVEKWFAFSPTDTLSINSGTEGQLTIVLNTPLGHQFPSGKETESINGVVNVTTSFVSKQLQLALDIQKVAVGITISGIQPTYNIQKKDGAYKKQAGFIEVRNSGEVLLTDVEAKVQCNPAASSWISFEGSAVEYQIQSIAKDQTQQVPYTIDVPATAKPAEIVNCKLGIFYKDPAGQRQSAEKQVLITTS